MKKQLGLVLGTLASAVLIAFALVTLIHAPQAGAQAQATNYFITAPKGSDPCQNPSVAKQSQSVAITSATTSNIISAVAGNFVSVCSWQLTVVGTSPTIQFEYGTTTSTACDTGATALTGAMAIPTTTIFVPPSGSEIRLRTPVSQQLCLVSGGTITGIEGFVVFTSQPF
jgi:hypothetical protein